MQTTVVKVGRSPYGTKWHVLRNDGYPVCGYASFNWNNGIEIKEIPAKDLKKLNLCANCRKKLR